MNTWKKYKLEEIATRIGDGLHGTPVYNEYGEYLFINGSNLMDGKIVVLANTKRVTEEEYKRHKRDLSENTILLGINGTIGNVALFNNEKCILGKSACYINVGKSFCRKFIYYAMVNQEFQNYIKINATGTTIKNVGLKLLREYEVSIPEDLPTQTRIASILSALDDKIEINRRTNHTLEQMAQTLFKKYFVTDIDPDNLPEGWRWGKLGEILSFRNGKSSPKRTDLSTYPVFGSNGIIGFCDISNADERSLIIGRVGSFCGSVYYCLQKSFVTDNAIIAETIFDNTSTYCFILLLSLNLNNYRGGSGQPLVNQTVLSNIEVIIPEIKVVNEYENIGYSFYKRIFQNETENNNLSKIRDSLLPKLMNGEITVN